MINKGFGFRHEDIQKNVAQMNYTFPETLSCKKSRPFIESCYESPLKHPQTMLLMGDSHMAVLTSGFVELFNEGRMNFNVLALGQSGCSYFLNTEGVFPNGSVKGCKKVFSQIIKEAIVRPDIKYVVIAGRHAERYSGTGFGTIEKGKIVNYRYQAQGKISKNNQEAFELGLQETLWELKKAGKKIIFVHHFPELGFDPIACLRKPIRFLEPKCSIDITTVNTRISPYKSAVTHVASNFQDLIQIEPYNITCDKSLCRPFNKEGELIYRDDNHISKIGARHLANLINEQLKI